MAVSASSVWEVRYNATSSNVNGGFFVAGTSRIDYSQQLSAQYNLTGLTGLSSSAVLPSTLAASDMVGNGLRVVSGSAFITGWYEVLSVVVGSSITLDRIVVTGPGSNGVANIGGALSLASSDDAIFETMEPGNVMWIKGSSYLIGGALSFSKVGTAALPIKVIGYDQTRGDNPMGVTRPLLDCAANGLTHNSFWEFCNIRITSTAAATFATAGAGGNKYINVLAINTSTTANRAAFNHTGASSGANNYYENCEGNSYRGYAFNFISTGAFATGCYAHDSGIGFRIGTGGGAPSFSLIGNLIESNATAAIDCVAGTNGRVAIQDNTIFGSINKTGTGISIITAAHGVAVLNNIIYGFNTGIVAADPANGNYGNYNDYFNNNTDRTNFDAGPNAFAVDPQFTNVGIISGSTATTAGGGVLTDPGGNFNAVVDHRDFINVISGSAVTPGQYLIIAHTGSSVTTSPAIASNATADKVYQITTGRDFSIGTNLKGVGFQGTFPAGLTVGYKDVGGVQRQESGGACDYPTNSSVLAGVVFGGGSFTGNLVVPGSSAVLNGQTFGPNNSYTGNVVLPGSSAVVAPETYGPSSGYSGAYNNVGTSAVIAPTVYGPSDSYTGVYQIVGSSDVIAPVAYGPGSSYFGVYGSPPNSVVQSGYAYGPSSSIVGTLVTGSSVSCDYPSNSSVLAGVVFGNSSFLGNLVLPGTSAVLSGQSFGPNNSYSGNVVLPGSSAVVAPTTYGPSSGYTGVYNSVGTSAVIAPVVYGPSNGYTGVYQIVGSSDVIAPVAYGPGSSYFGVYGSPPQSVVQSGYTYGPGSSLVGTLNVNPGSSTIIIGGGSGDSTAPIEL